MPRSVTFFAIASLILGTLSAAPVSAAERLRVLALGTGTTAPSSAARKVYTERLAAKLEGVHIRSIVLNEGLSGRRSEPALRIVEAVALPRVPDVVILEFGAQDGLVDPKSGRARLDATQFRENLRTMVERLQRDDVGVVVMSPAPLFWNEPLIHRFGATPYDVSDPWGLNLQVREFARVAGEVARTAKVPFVDTFQLFEEKDRALGNGEATGRVRDEWTVDGARLNDAAHEAIADALARAIVPAVRSGALRVRANRRPQPGLAGAPRVTFVEAGRALGLRSRRTALAARDAVVLEPSSGTVYAAHSIGNGDFSLHARLSVETLGMSTNAAVRLGSSRFSFGGADGVLTYDGSDDRTPRRLEPASSYLFEKTPFDLEVHRVAGRVTYSIDGTPVFSTKQAGAIPFIAFEPGTTRLTLEHLTVRGHTAVLGSIMPQGYTIPTIDLAAETDRQTIVDREPGQYLGHPTTLLLEDGKTILTVYPKGHGRGPICYKRSTDGGRTWSDRLPVPDNWSTSKETPSIHRVVDADGKKRLIVFSGLYPARLAVSEDDGVTWSPLAPVGDWGGIVVMGSVERLADGRYLALFHDDGRFIRGEGKATGFDVYRSVSSDGGLTWSEPVSIARHPRAHLCEPGLVRSPDGKQIAVLLRENSRRYNSFVIFSDDEGETWTPPIELPAALTGDRHTARYAPDGRLLISFRDTTRESPTRGDWVAWVGKYEDIVAGREGQYRVRLMDNHVRADCAYPGVEVLPDGTFVLTTYGHWTPGESPYIVSIRLRLEELDVRAGR